jgi:hypothetical protein
MRDSSMRSGGGWLEDAGYRTRLAVTLMQNRRPLVQLIRRKAKVPGRLAEISLICRFALKAIPGGHDL